MLEEKKPRDSLQQGSADADQPKTPNINPGTRNSATGKTNRVSKSNNGINPVHRFALLSERCAPSPVPGPLPSPLLGGLPGSSLLIAQQAASLRLAQLKAQLALTQISNALGVGSQAATFTANCNTPAPYISTKPPSPTAAAINLLNVLKIANTMSHPLYNPYASGNQSSTQGQYGHPSMQAESDPRRSSCLGPGSNFGSSGGSSLIPDTSGGIPSSSSSHSMNYRPEQGRAIMDKDLERSIDMHISRAREEVRVLGKPVHHPFDQDSRFTSTQRHDFCSSGTGMVSYPMSSTSAVLGHRHSDNESGGTSLDWSSNYKRPTADDSKFYSSPVSSNNASSRDDRFFPPSERPRDMQSIPGLGNYDRQVPDRTAAPSESTRPKYTSESAANILLHFGLEKEDLEELLSYPEDQITPANLPYILRQIRIRKAKRTTTTVQTKSYPESVSQRDSHSLSSSGSSSILQPSKVIDYGHTGKYTGGVVDDSGKTSVSRPNSGGSGSMLLMDNFSSSRHTREPLQKNTTVVKSSALGSSQQASSVTSLSSSYSPVLNSPAPPSHDQTKQLQISQANLSSSSFVLPKKDTDLRVLKAEVSKSVPVKEAEADRQSALKTQPPCTPLFRGVHPGRPGLVLIGSNNNSGTKGQSKTPGHGSTVPEQIKKQQTVEQQSKQQMQKQPVAQPGQANWPPVFSAAKPVPPAPLNPNITDASRPMQRMMFHPDDPRSMVIPPLLPQPIQNFNHMALPPSSRQPPAKVAVTKGLPTLAMMHDYAAASPRIFPHTCSLCNKECTHMKDWLSHQNTNLHLESCRLLRNRYPDWDGEILRPRAGGKDAKPQALSSAQTSQQRHQKTSRGSHSHSRSRSSSPRRHHGSEGRRERRSSPSRSPHNSRYAFRSRSRSPSPRYDHPTSSRYRLRSRSPERRLSPRRREERWSSPRRDDDRRSSPRKNDGRWSPPRRSGERRSPPRRSHERRSSAEASSPQRKKSSSAEKLAKKLLGTSAVQSLSKQSDLDTVVKTLAPVLLAELVKMKSSSSPSSSSSKGGKPSSSSTPAGGKRSSSTASSSSTSSTAKKKVLASKAKPSLQKSEASSSTNTKSGKSSPPTMVRLEGIRSSLTHNDVIAAVEQFGKTKSVLLFRSKLEAIVCFEKEEDAKKLRAVKNLDVKGLPVNVVREKKTDSKDQKKPPRNKPVSPSASRPHTISTTKITTNRKEKIAAKGSVKGLMTVTKAKVLVSKAKNISTKQMTKMVKTGKLSAKGPVKKAGVKQKTSSGSKPRASENQPKAGDSKQKPIHKTSETSVKGSLVMLKETDEIDKLKIMTVTEPTKSKDIVTNEKVMASKAEMASTAQKSKTSEDKLAVAGAVAKEKVEEAVAKAGSVPSKSTTSENRPDVLTSMLKEAVVVPKDTAEVVETANVTGIEPVYQASSEPTKSKDIVTNEKVMASKAEMASTAQKSKTSEDKLAVAGAVAKEKVEETVAKAGSVPSKSTTSENRPDVLTSKLKESETKVKEAVVVPKDTAKVVETVNVTRIEPVHQAKPDEADRTEDDEQMQLGETGVKVAEPMEVGSCADNKEKKLTTTEAVSENSADKPSDSQPPTSTVQTQPTESSVSSLTHVQQSTLLEPEPPKSKLVSECSETSVKGSVMMLEKVDAVVTVTEPTKREEVVSKAKVMVSKVDTASTMQKPKTSEDKLPVAGAVAKEKVETAAKAVSVPSQSTASENCPVVETSKPKESETKVQEALLVPKDTAKVLEAVNVTGIEPKHQAKLDEANQAEDVEPMQLGETGVTEAIEVGSCTDDKGQKLTESSAPSDSQPPTSIVQTLPTESSVKSSTHDQKSTLSEPEPTAQKPESSETSGKESVMMLTKQKVDKSPNQTVTEPTRGKEIVTKAKAMASKAETASTTQKSATSGGADPAGSVKAKTAQKDYLTLGEMAGHHIKTDKIGCLSYKTIFSPRFAQIGQKQMLITLPKYFSSTYTEDELARLLIPFGFQYRDENIYVIPQARMAIIQLPTLGHVQQLTHVSMNGIFFKGVPIYIRAMAAGIPMTPFEFYKKIMKMMKMPVIDGLKIVFIKNISVTETRALRETLRKMQFVKNYLPLLNKVFVEFKNIRDVDRLGVWYSLLKRPPGYEVHRLKTPHGKDPGISPHLPESAVPDSEDCVPGVIVPNHCDIPPGSTAPFWVTMRSRPFVYPTVGVWFNIPKYLTAKGKADIEKARHILRSSKSPTIMLTGLPEGDYKHEDVAKLVWRYFPKQNLHSLYYNITVLPLQRRAFVHFPDWTSCIEFLRDPHAQPYYIKNCRLTSHFVLDGMKLESSEEMKYKTLMKLSNAGVPEEKSLEERLLCVEISETSVEVIGMVMEVVATLATFVNFLPLGNRICVEMAESSGVKRVVEKYRTVSRDPTKQSTWIKVQRFESLKSLKQRLQDSSEITIHFEPDTVNLKAKTPTQPPTQPPTVKCQTQPLPPERLDNGSQPALQASGPGGSTPSKPITAGPSATAASDVAMGEDVETAMDSTVGPGANEDVEKAKGEDTSLTTLNSAADVTSTSAVSSGNTVPSAAGLTPEESFAELPQIDTDIFKALKAAVHQYRLTRESKPQSEEEEEEEEESTKKSNTSSRTAASEETPQRTVQDNFEKDGISSDAYLFDEQNFNMDDFVTVDEVGEDLEDTSSEPESVSTSKQSSRRRERHGSGRLSEGKLTSTRSSTDSKRPASSSSSSSSSKSTKGSSSASPKESKNSSEPTKSFTKPLSTASVSKSSTYAPRLSAGIPSSPGQKTEQSKTTSTSKASNSASSGRSTRSSSAACEREKITSAATVKASMQTHPKPHRDEAKATEGAVTASDHKASAEGTAAKTEIETSSERHPPPQEHGIELSQGQSPEINVNVNTLKDQKKSKEEEEKDDADKHIEDDDNIENYQILDSLDQTDEQTEDGNEDDSSKTQQTGPEDGQTVADEGKAHPEEYSEMEINSPFQVLDSVTEDQAATSQEDSHMVQDDGSTIKQLSEKGATSVVDKSEGKDQETNDKDNFQVLDICSIQAPGSKEGGEKKKHKEEVKLVSAESCKAFKDVETPDDRILNEDQPLQNRDNEDPDSDVIEQETFEILDSIDDQTATEDDGQKHETPTDDISKEEVSPREEEQDSYQVIDSLEDQQMTTEPESETDNKGKRTKRGEATATKDDKPSKKSGPTTRASKSEEMEKSPKKEDRTVKKYETRTKRDTTAGVKEIKEATEEMMYEIVDSVEDEPVQETATTERSGRRRSTRGKKEEKITLEPTEVSEKPNEEATYKILDSVEEETADDEPIVTRRSTRGKVERTSKDTPTRTRQTPARESQERNREKTPKKGERSSPRHSTPTKKSDVVVGELSEDVTCEIFDSMEDKVKDDRPGAGKRGRPKKEVKTTRKDIVTLKKEDKDTPEEVVDDEEVTYQILDSVEDETVDGQPPSEPPRKTAASLTGSTKNEEEEPMYEIVDSLEDDQEELNATEVSDVERKKKSDETPANEDTPTTPCGTTVVEGSEKQSLCETGDDLEKAHDDPSAAEDSAMGEEERASKTDIKKEDKSTTKSRLCTATQEEEKKQKSPEKNNPASTLVNLDEVSEEEEDYPDDTAEEEELRKRQAATKKKQYAKEREARRTTEREKRTRDREERERMSRSSSSSRSRSRGGGDRGGTRRTKERGRENEEEVDTKELVTLDEVGADEAGEERVPESREWDEEITEGELQALVTLDEFVEEEDEKKTEQSTPETRPLLQEDESVDSLNPETLVTLDEAGGDKDEEPDEEQAEKTSRSAKRKHDGNTEENMNFVTVDEVGEVEEEEEKQAVTARTRGRPKKRSRQTPVRKSARGKKVSTEEEKEAADVPPPTSLDASSSSDKDPSMSLSDDQQEVQKTEVEAASQANVEAAYAGQELQPERPENQTVEERQSRADIKVVNKRRSELVGPEPKRSRSQSPCVTADFKMPTFKPNNPLGQEFIVPKSGYFCNLCSIFYVNENNAKDVHCSSRKHYDNLKKHYEKLGQKRSRSSAQSSHDSVSD